MIDEQSGRVVSVAAGNGPTAPGAPNADVADLPFDKALAELQTVVGRLESGGLALEDSIALYERGVALHERCATLLGNAELRVQRLVESAGGRLNTLDLRPDEAE